MDSNDAASDERQTVSERKTEQSSLAWDKSCPDEAALTLAIAAAADTYRAKKRDNAYRRVVDSALTCPDFEIATRAASGIYYASSRDKAFLEIVKVAVKVRKYDEANHAASKVYYANDRDYAKRLVVDALTSE